MSLDGIAATGENQSREKTSTGQEQKKTTINNNGEAGQTHSQAKNKNKTRNRNNRNKKSNNKGRSNFDENAPNIVEGSSSSTENVSKEKVKSVNKAKNTKKLQNKKKLTTPGRALYKELEKLLPHINPITINGIPVKNLSTEPLPYLKKIVNDKSNQNEIFMTFLMKPTDPDFPYDIELLTITLCIPQTYPYKLPSPTIMVLDDDIPRGFGVNIEIGFKQIVATILENRMNNNLVKKQANSDKPQKGKALEGKNNSNDDDDDDDASTKIDVVGGKDLCGMVMTLDRYLEKFLSMEKKDTIKLVKVINKKQESASSSKIKIDEAHHSKKTQVKPTSVESISNEVYQKRTDELDRFKQRLRDNHITVFKNNAQGTIFKLCLFFKDDNFTLEFEDSDEVVIEKLYIKLTVPNEYLNNSKKGIKVDVDMSNNYNIKLVNSIGDTSIRLIFGKLINNISKNFPIYSSEIAALNCEYTKIGVGEYWTITSQLNFFLHNIQKFMNEKAEFQNWYEANKMMNQELL